jgi:hypothetical protein
MVLSCDINTKESKEGQKMNEEEYKTESSTKFRVGVICENHLIHNFLVMLPKQMEIRCEFLV